MPTRTVELTEHLEDFIDSGIASGAYRDADEVVRRALRLLERQHQSGKRLERLAEAVKAGAEAFDRGDFTSVESDEALRGFMGAAQEEAAAELRTRVE